MTDHYTSVKDIPEAKRRGLEQFVSNLEGDTFILQNLPPELTGAVLARYSRAPTGLRETLAAEFLDDKGVPSVKRGSELLDRVLIQYGDDSVGELEGAHVGIEKISQIAVKTIEDHRIGGSPIEQSTRYVKFDVKNKEEKWNYLRPSEIMATEWGEKFERVTDSAFEVYSEAIKRLSGHIRSEVYPMGKHTIEATRGNEKKKVGESELQGEAEERAFRNSYNFTVRCAALDIGRCVLPSSTLTQVGLYGNGRFFTHLITTLKSSELEEERRRGAALEAELMKTIPTFIKRNKKDESYSARNERMRKLADELFRGIKPQDNKVTLVIPSPSLFTNIVAAGIFPYTNISLQQITATMMRIPPEKRSEVLDVYIGERKERRNRSGRGLEAGYPFIFDLVGSFGEYRDLQRHRMVTQQRQDLTPDLGFVMPPEMKLIGMMKDVENVEGEMRKLNETLRKEGLEESAQYATLFNHRMRFYMGMNLQAFQHLAELRTQPAGHFGYRAMVQEMAKRVINRHPWTKLVLQFVDYSDPDNKISRAQEQGRIAGKNLARRIEGAQDYTE